MHTPVLLNEVLDYLNLASGKKFIDCTLNGGGHTKAVLEKFSGVEILGIEYDPVIAAQVSKELSVKVVNDSYINLRAIAEAGSFYPDAVLFDLGLSSWHYESSGRGFSFQKNEPLDMRFNPMANSLTAAEIINMQPENDICEILKEYGEEQFAESISRAIIKARQIKPIRTTLELAEIISNSVPGWYKKRKINPATKTFQALRIAVNDELENVKRGVAAAIDVLNPGGRLVVISFQGLEDKIVREIFKEKAKEGILKYVVRGTIRPTWTEQQSNPRSRSAKMKVAEKTWGG